MGGISQNKNINIIKGGNLPDIAVYEFIEIYENNYGIKLSFEDAKIKAIATLELLHLVFCTNNKKIGYNKDADNLHMVKTLRS